MRQFPYLFNTSIVLADPGEGGLSLNNVVPGEATVIRVNGTDALDVNRSANLYSWENGNLIIRSVVNPEIVHVFSVNELEDFEVWVRFKNATHISGTGSLSMNEPIEVGFRVPGERPEVSDATEELYKFIEAFVEHDGDETDWETLELCDAIMGGTVQTVFAWVTDREDLVGWAYLFNADESDAAALPWLAQLNGTHLREDMTIKEQREAIKTHAGFDRGTPAAIKGAPDNYLTGTKVVYLREREEGKAYHIHVRTLASETPDKAVVLEALLLQKPAGITMDYDTITGQDWLDVKGKHATWNAVKAAYTDWDDVRSTAP